MEEIKFSTGDKSITIFWGSDWNFCWGKNVLLRAKTPGHPQECLVLKRSSLWMCIYWFVLRQALTVYARLQALPAQLSQHWDYRCARPYPTSTLILFSPMCNYHVISQLLTCTSGNTLDCSSAGHNKRTHWLLVFFHFYDVKEKSSK